MNIPAQIRAGDLVQWTDNTATDNLGNVIDSSWALKYYLRTNASNGGVTLTAAASGQGWLTTLDGTTSGGMAAGQWFWQASVSKAGNTITLGAGQVTVQASLAYSGSAAAFDGRTQLQKDLEAVQAAIRALVSGGVVQEYSIGNRRLKKYALPDLLQLEAKLKAEVKREQTASLMAQGLGNPHKIYVRF